MITAVLAQVAASPPPRFSGGGMWEAMHDTMAGCYEVRVNGAGRRHYRLFCVLDSVGHDHKGNLVGPYLVVIDGADKAFRSTMPDSVYRRAASLTAEYRRRDPRSIS